MSCHDIGRGMNSVTEVVAKMYIDKEITKDVAFRLFKALQKGVHWCDGNEYEATASLEDLLCGRCLKHFDDSEYSVDLWDTIDTLYNVTDGREEADDELVQQCTELFAKIREKDKGSGFCLSVNNTFWELLKKETVSCYVCEDCFKEILNKYLETN